MGSFVDFTAPRVDTMLLDIDFTLVLSIRAIRSIAAPCSAVSNDNRVPVRNYCRASRTDVHGHRHGRYSIISALRFRNNVRNETELRNISFPFQPAVQLFISVVLCSHVYRGRNEEFYRNRLRRKVANCLFRPKFLNRRARGIHGVLDWKLIVSRERFTFC